jgi:hypothetical protein
MQMLEHQSKEDTKEMIREVAAAMRDNILVQRAGGAANMDMNRLAVAAIMAMVLWAKDHPLRIN